MGGVESGGQQYGTTPAEKEGLLDADFAARAAFLRAYEGGDGGKGECGIDRLNAMMPDLEDGARLAHKLATLENQRGALLQMLEGQWEHDVRPNVGDFFAPDVSEALEEIGKRTRLASAEWQANRPCRPDRLSEG